MYTINSPFHHSFGVNHFFHVHMFLLNETLSNMLQTKYHTILNPTGRKEQKQKFFLKIILQKSVVLPFVKS